MFVLVSRRNAVIVARKTTVLVSVIGQYRDLPPSGRDPKITVSALTGELARSDNFQNVKMRLPASPGTLRRFGNSRNIDVTIALMLMLT